MRAVTTSPETLIIINQAALFLDCSIIVHASLPCPDSFSVNVKLMSVP
jgi:hypothetical protein